MAMKIWRNYKVGLRWFLLSSIFAEAAASAVGSTAVIFLNLNLQLNALQIGIFFEVSLIGVVAGTKVRFYQLFIRSVFERSLPFEY
jgi:MFS-type transporter involved in bile tolerance (Atg22 family)